LKNLIATIHILQAFNSIPFGLQNLHPPVQIRVPPLQVTISYPYSLDWDSQALALSAAVDFI
ncbi:hypothetical protein, partial [Trichormus variabilis]|uniref:hypothetical protein n=1 Tax=Anabaena variabilis TaxID=264691 RepID=UPI001A917109